MFVLLSAATPSRLLDAFPPGVRVSRVHLDEAIAPGERAAVADSAVQMRWRGRRRRMKTLTLLRHAKSGWDDAGRARFRSAAERARPQGGAGDGARDAARSASLRPRPRLAGGARGRDARRSSRRAMAARSAAAYDERIYLASPATLLDLVRAADDAARAAAARRPQSGPRAARSAAARRPARCATDRRQISDRRARRDRASTWPLARRDARPGRLARFIRPRDLVRGSRARTT